MIVCISKLVCCAAQEDAIEIYTPDRPYTIYVKSRNEKKLWLKKLSETIVHHLNHSAKKDAVSEETDISEHTVL